MVALVGFSGCSYKAFNTPAVMTYDGTSVDYSTIRNMKNAKVCKEITSGDGDITTIAAAEKAGISKIKHVDTTFEYKQFLFWSYDGKRCTIVYGE
jgi:hypothetical protein